MLEIRRDHVVEVSDSAMYVLRQVYFSENIDGKTLTWLLDHGKVELLDDLTSGSIATNEVL